MNAELPTTSSASSMNTTTSRGSGSFGSRGKSAAPGSRPMEFIAFDEPQMNRDVAAAFARIVRALRLSLKTEAA